MDIQSAFNSGIQGFNRAKETVAESSAAINSTIVNDIAIQQASSIEGAAAANNDNSENNPQEFSQSPNNITNINQELVDLKVAEFQAKASVNVIRTADEVLGTLLDVTA